MINLKKEKQYILKMNTSNIKKVFAVIGVFATLAHLAYYSYSRYDALYFFLGFGILWLVFVVPLKYLK